MNKKITLYHGTKQTNIESIKRNGIRAGIMHDVDLVTSKLYASTYADSGGAIIKIVIPVNLVNIIPKEYGEVNKLIFATATFIHPKYIKSIKIIK